MLLLLCLALGAAPVVGAQTSPTPPAPAPRLAATSGAPAADEARDQAIEKLTAFLARYPASPLRPNALFQLGELLVRRADEEFATAQRSGARDAPERPEYGDAIARYEEIVAKYPNFEKTDAAAYTLGTLYFSAQRYDDAVKMFELVSERPASHFRPEAYFRLGDAEFELASTKRGEPRKALFVKAAQAYEQATRAAQPGGDIYFLSLYKLGWSYYNQATQINQPEYERAVETFGRLVSEYDKLSPTEQARLGLRSEAIEYMAVALTQVGGADAANRYFAAHGGGGFKLVVLRRVAASLRDQGDFPKAVEAYKAVLADAPSDSGALAAQQEIIDIYQNRVLEPEQAQQARLQLVSNFAPGTPWASANPSLVDSAQRAREQALRQSAQYDLAHAQETKDRARFTEAAELYGRYLREFASADSAQAVNFLYGEALYGGEQFFQAGVQYSHSAYGYPSGDPKLAAQAGQNAIVAFDSAVVRSPADSGAQDSLFAAVDQYVTAFPSSEIARKALIEKGRRASEAKRWDVMAATFRTYAEKYPSDSYTPTAQKLIGDALYKGGQYTEAQAQWEHAQAFASSAGRRALADSITTLRNAAAVSYGDSLVKAGDYQRAADEVYVAYADRNPSSDKAPDALRNAIETYMLADSAARAHADSGASQAARQRALELSTRLVEQYPNYKFRVQYQGLQAQLLADLGKREEAATALASLVSDNPKWPGRPDAMVRLAVVLDSLGKQKEAAQAYEEFAADYPKDKRAADAQFNAAVTYLEASDSADAARAYGIFATHFPRDSRVGQAQAARVALLRAVGNESAANTELARLCAKPSDAIRSACAERQGEQEFRAGQSLFPKYQTLKFVIPRKSNLTRAGVQRISSPKRELLARMTTHFTKAIAAGAPEWLSAATYYAGLAQWEYGNYLSNVELPASLSEQERAAAQAGSARQAEQYYQAASKLWQGLVDKATKDNFDNPWVQRAKDALQGKVDATPETGALSPKNIDAGGAR